MLLLIIFAFLSTRDSALLRRKNAIVPQPGIKMDSEIKYEPKLRSKIGTNIIDLSRFVEPINTRPKVKNRRIIDSNHYPITKAHSTARNSKNDNYNNKLIVIIFILVAAAILLVFLAATLNRCMNRKENISTSSDDASSSGLVSAELDTEIPTLVVEDTPIQTARKQESITEVANHLIADGRAGQGDGLAKRIKLERWMQYRGDNDSTKEKKYSPKKKKYRYHDVKYKTTNKHLKPAPSDSKAREPSQPLAAALIPKYRNNSHIVYLSNFERSEMKFSCSGDKIEGDSNPIDGNRMTKNMGIKNK